MASSPKGKRFCINGPIFLLEPNAFDLRIAQNALGDSLPLHQFKQESSLLNAYERLQRPALTIVSWDSIRRSASVLERVVAASPETPVLLLCHSHDNECASVAARAGVTGILKLPMDAVELRVAIEAYLQKMSLQVSIDQLPADEITLPDGTLFVCCNKKMQAIKRQAELVARSDIPVLILGESGTGKEVLARYVHAMSDRCNQVFLKVNCAAVPRELLESEFFGHEKGAFTGAVTSVQGKFELCAGGTIFLDEIGEMPAALQAKLLHILQDGSYTRLGGGAPQQTNVRVIAATNINMKAAIAAKDFREDLYYRLSGFTMTALPLRERRDEIPVFARRFMQRSAHKHKCAPLKFSDALMNALQHYRWPGNLRELENVVNRYLVLRDEHTTLSELGHQGPHGCDDVAIKDVRGEGSLKQQLLQLSRTAEAAAIAKALEETGWNRKAAARKMKISYTSLLQKIKLYALAKTAHPRADVSVVREQEIGVGFSSTARPGPQLHEPKPPMGIRAASASLPTSALFRAASGK